MTTEIDSEGLLPWKNPELWSRLHSRHGHTSRLGGRKDSPTYTSWQAMRARCKYASRDVEAKYVNRGISHHPEWESFEKFLADMGERPDGSSLDRIDNNGDYGPENCRWSTPTEQARNRRNTRLTYEQAVDVAVRRMRGEPCKSIAESYGISESMPREIAKGRTWRDAYQAALEITAND